MNVVTLGPPSDGEAPRLLDAPLPNVSTGPRSNDSIGFSNALGRAYDDASAALDRAAAAESAFASGKGGLQEMVLERAQADIALSIASAAASRTAQALTTILGMQI